MTAGYYIGKVPVTVGQFKRFVTDTHYRTDAEIYNHGSDIGKAHLTDKPGISWQRPGFSQTKDHPVVNVSWRDVQAFTLWGVDTNPMHDPPPRPKRNGNSPHAGRMRRSIRGARLVRWLALQPRRRFDAQALGTSHRSSPISAHDTDGHVFTSPVGAFDNASWCGALDMAGNVAQICTDYYVGKRVSNTAAGRCRSDGPPDPATATRFARGRFVDAPRDLRSARRLELKERNWFLRVGFRIAFTPKRIQLFPEP